MRFRQIVPSLIEITGGKHERSDPEIVSRYSGDFKYAFLMLIDSLGKYQMQYFRRPMVGDYYDLDTVVPSLTPTAILSLVYGMKPDEHGIIGGVIRTSHTKGLIRTIDATSYYRVRVPLDMAGMNMRALFLKEPPSFEGKFLVATNNLLRYGLSSFFEDFIAIIHGDLGYLKYLNDLKDGGVMKHYYRYYDATAHDFGPYSREAQLELRMSAYRLRKIALSLPQEMRDKTLFVILGDHGQDEIVIDPLNMPDLRSSIGSAGKIYYVYSKEALERIEEKIDKNEYEILEPEEYRKLLGDSETNEKELMYRIGEGVIIPKGGRMLRIGDNPPDLRGMHGGLTEEEMKVRVQFLDRYELLELTDRFLL